MRVELPVRQPDASQGPQESGSAAPGQGFDPPGVSGDLGGLDVLVVEDNADASEILRVVLGDRGARVRVAVDFQSAVDAARQSWPDVLVSDIGLAGRDGYELIRQIRRMTPANRAALPAIALTAFARPDDRNRALQAGFDAHLGKPLKPHELVREIGRLMRRPA